MKHYILFVFDRLLIMVTDAYDSFMLYVCSYVQVTQPVKQGNT